MTRECVRKKARQGAMGATGVRKGMGARARRAIQAGAVARAPSGERGHAKVSAQALAKGWGVQSGTGATWAHGVCGCAVVDPDACEHARNISKLCARTRALHTDESADMQCV